MRAQIYGLRVQHSRFKKKGFRVEGTRLITEDFASKVQGSGPKIEGSGLKVQGRRFGASGSRPGLQAGFPGAI